MNARKCVYSQSSTPVRYLCMKSKVEEEKKERKRKKRGRETGKAEARRLMERKVDQQNKINLRN